MCYLLCRRWTPRLADGEHEPEGPMQNAEGKQPHAWQSSAASASSHKEGEQGRYLSSMQTQITPPLF